MRIPRLSFAWITLGIAVVCLSRVAVAQPGDWVSLGQRTVSDRASQTIESRSTIPAGGESRAIDLEGTDRVIRSVEFWYDAKTVRGRRAVVRLFGRR
jgi:hypothetical protein